MAKPRYRPQSSPAEVFIPRWSHTPRLCLQEPDLFTSYEDSIIVNVQSR